MNRFRLAFSIGSIAVCAAAFAQPQKDVPASLRAAISYGAAMRYAGTRIVEFRVGAEIRRHVEHVWRDGERTRIEFPADSEFAGQVIVELGDKRRHFFPDSNEILVLPARREEAFERLRAVVQMVRQGAVRMGSRDGGAVAGLRTELVALNDPSGNPIQRLWIEPRSGMILKREMFDPVGARVGYFEFTRVQLNPSFRQNEFLIARRGADEVTPEQQLQRLARQSGISAPVIPRAEGYQLESARLLNLAGEPVIAQNYIGRGGRLSLFSLKGRVDPQRLRRLAKGDFAVHIWDQGEVTLALVGEQSQAELAALARRMNR